MKDDQVNQSVCTVQREAGPTVEDFWKGLHGVNLDEDEAMKKRNADQGSEDVMEEAISQFVSSEIKNSFVQAEPVKSNDLHLDVNLETARALHRVWRALNDGDCPKCHRHCAATAIIRKENGRDDDSMACPNCGFEIFDYEIKEIEKLFAPAMDAAVRIFEGWRTAFKPKVRTGGPKVVQAVKKMHEPPKRYCFAECVALIIGIDVKQVPHFCSAKGWDFDGFQRWLGAKGLVAFDFQVDNGSVVQPTHPRERCIISGMSPRGRKKLHCVVGDLVGPNKFELLVDPHSSGLFFIGNPTHATFILPKVERGEKG